MNKSETDCIRSEVLVFLKRLDWQKVIIIIIIII